MFSKLKTEFDSNACSVEMPRYKCHKEVWALKIKELHRAPANPDPNTETDECEGGAMLVPADSGYGPIYLDASYLRRHKPEVGGYYIIYKDGYTSFSPAVAFEEGYARI